MGSILDLLCGAYIFKTCQHERQMSLQVHLRESKEIDQKLSSPSYSFQMSHLTISSMIQHPSLLLIIQPHTLKFLLYRVLKAVELRAGDAGNHQQG